MQPGYLRRERGAGHTVKFSMGGAAPLPAQPAEPAQPMRRRNRPGQPAPQRASQRAYHDQPELQDQVDPEEEGAAGAGPSDANGATGGKAEGLCAPTPYPVAFSIDAVQKFCHFKSAGLASQASQPRISTYVDIGLDGLDGVVQRRHELGS